MAGIFDPALKDLQRAPVDEFFAGRNSAMIDDDEWDLTVSQAERLLGRKRGGKNGNLDSAEGSDDDMAIREAIQEETGLFMYPGQGIKTPPKDVAFMQEFDDSGASLSEGWRDSDMPSTLGGLLQHEELYKHYPELAQMPIVNEEDPQLYGWYGDVSEENPIGMMGVQSQASDGEVLGTLLHEAQHYVQDLEGWPAGASHGARKTLESFAAGQPDRFKQWDDAFRREPEGSEREASIRDDVNWESYANASGEILARDVEDRFDKRNELNAAKDALVNPKNPRYYPNRKEESKDHLLGRLNSQSDSLDTTYPYLERTYDNRYPHDISESEEIMPLLMTAAMGSRKGDKHAEKSKNYAEGLLEEIMKNRGSK